MSQRCQRKRWTSLVHSTRHFSAFAVLAIAVAGCSVPEMEKFALEGDELSATEARQRTDTGLSQKVGKELLSAESIIRGGRRSYKGVTGQLSRLFIGEADEIQLQRPVAVGGVEGLLYIVDAEPKIVYKYDLVINDLEPVEEIATHLGGDPGNIYVAKDRSFYLVDSIGRQVLHFSEHGELKTRFQDLANLSRPMDVLVNEETGDVYVADGSFSRIVVFNSIGKAIRAIGQRGTGPGRFRAMTAITSGADGLYVLDRLELPAQVLDWDGNYRYSFGESDLIFPNAIAVDKDQRAFISDRSDNTIRVYQNGQLLLKFGGGGSSPGKFRLPSGLWVNGNLLYVADSLNRRVQVLRINPTAAATIAPTPIN
jgi:DNA-binding beta-propeller fold protein YncE